MNAEIFASRSATFTLEKWCGDHRLSGAEPKTVARQAAAERKPATTEQRQRLDVGPAEGVRA